ncbi:hypothetical protein GGS20DRAFT_587908 [Poronia punctata]|nr:hypothetical protein GGS20DRAFT_587908 [Poronia punctata]
MAPLDTLPSNTTPGHTMTAADLGQMIAISFLGLLVLIGGLVSLARGRAPSLTYYQTAEQIAKRDSKCRCKKNKACHRHGYGPNERDWLERSVVINGEQRLVATPDSARSGFESAPNPCDSTVALLKT